MKINQLLLQTGGDIPFPTARVTVHNPSLKEIGLIGDKDFFIGCHFLTFNKDILSDQDKIGLEDKSDFEIFMSVVNSQEKAIHKTDALMVLALLFPQYQVKINKDRILLQSEEGVFNINAQNFDDFRCIINQIFCLDKKEGEAEYNPADALAARIAEKIKKGKQKRNKKAENEDKEISIFGKFISVLSVGLHKSKNELSDYTVYQIRDEYQRFLLKQDYDLYLKAKLAGAQDMEEVQNWMDDIHP